MDEREEILFFVISIIVSCAIYIAYGAVQIYIFGNTDSASTIESLIVLCGSVALGFWIAGKLINKKH